MSLRNTIFIVMAITTLVVSLAVSCKPKPQPINGCDQNPSACNSVLVAKEFFLFKPGSWWVYEEENSGVRDSMYVINYVNGNDYNFLMEIKSALDDYEYSYWPVYVGQPNDAFCSKTNSVIKKCLNIKLSKGKSGDFVGESNCFFVQFSLYDSLQAYSSTFPNNTLRFSEILDHFDNGINHFDLTAIVENKHTLQDNNQHTKIFYSKGVGIVRRELIDSNQVWNLVSYHIEP